MPDALALAAAAAEPARVRSRTFAALWDYPAYRRFYAGQGVSLLGTWLQAAAVSWIVFEMTGSERWLGIVEAASLLPGLLVGLPAGAIADRVAPRALILGMQVGQMLLAFALAALVGLGVVRIWQIIAILALARICVTFEMPSRQVLLHDLVGRSALMNAIALNSGLFNASRVVGPALAGLCLEGAGRTAPFLLNGASYLAAIAALATIPSGRRRPAPAESGHSTTQNFGLLGGLAYLRRDGRVRALFGLLAFFGLVGMGYAALMPAYARRVVGTDAVGYSALLACGGVGATAGALLVASLGNLRRKERLVPGGVLLFAAALAAAGTLPGVARDLLGPGAALPVAGVCLLGTGFGGIIFFSSTQTLIQTAVPDHLRGRIMGIWMIVYSGSVPLGALWAGELARRQGVALVLHVSASLCAAVAVGVSASGMLMPRDRA